MNKFLHILRLFFEILVAPFNVFIKSNGVGLENSRWTKAWVIFLVAIVLVALLVLFYYRQYFAGLVS